MKLDVGRKMNEFVTKNMCLLFIYIFGVTALIINEINKIVIIKRCDQN